MEVQSYAPGRSAQTALYPKAVQLNYFAPDGAAAEAVAAARALLLKSRISRNQALETLEIIARVTEAQSYARLTRNPLRTFPTNSDVFPIQAFGM